MKTKPQLITYSHQPLAQLLGFQSSFALASKGTLVRSTKLLAHELTHTIQQSGLAKGRHIRVIGSLQFKYLSPREIASKLKQIFLTAELNQTILIFDEADALFGKRTEVKDSHDRYANTDTNYLLEAVSRYGGLVFVVQKDSDEDSKQPIHRSSNLHRLSAFPLS